MKNKNRRLFKKVLSLLLSLSLVISFSIPAFAADDSNGSSLFDNLFTKTPTESINELFNDLLDRWDDESKSLLNMGISAYLDGLMQKYEIRPETNVSAGDFANVIKEIFGNTGGEVENTQMAEKIFQTLVGFLERTGTSGGNSVSEEDLRKAIEVLEEAIQSADGTEGQPASLISEAVLKAINEAGISLNQESLSLISTAIASMLDSISLEGMEKVSVSDVLEGVKSGLQGLVEGGGTITDSELITTIITEIQNYINGINGGEEDLPDGSPVTLTIVTNDGSEPIVIDAFTGQSLDLSEIIPTREGYTFEGWYLDEALSQQVTVLDITGNMTIYAKWTENIVEPDPVEVNPFTDVNESDYFYNPVLWAVKYGITEGTSPTTFSPESACTRAQAMTFIWRAAGEPTVSGQYNAFTDIKPSDYYYQAVLWGVSIGLTTGTSPTTFSPNDPCTRAQIVTFLYRGSGKTVYSGATPFTDVPEDAYYAKAVSWAVSEGITTGTSATTFSPDLTCTRGQIVTFLYRFVN